VAFGACVATAVAIGVALTIWGVVVYRAPVIDAGVASVLYDAGAFANLMTAFPNAIYSVADPTDVRPSAMDRPWGVAGGRDSSPVCNIAGAFRSIRALGSAAQPRPAVAHSMARRDRRCAAPAASSRDHVQRLSRWSWIMVYTPAALRPVRWAPEGTATC